jgi:hypothetical protein
MALTTCQEGRLDTRFHQAAREGRTSNRSPEPDACEGTTPAHRQRSTPLRMWSTKWDTGAAGVRSVGCTRVTYHHHVHLGHVGDIGQGEGIAGKVLHTVQPRGQDIQDGLQLPPRLGDHLRDRGASRGQMTEWVRALTVDGDAPPGQAPPSHTAPSAPAGALFSLYDGVAGE